jgi:SAM-dependent methyltransferase
VADLNTWLPSTKLDGAIAHHSLHHIVELEHLFAGVASALKPSGVFVSADMIGRNGHMRWPEVESVISRLWKVLPDRYKTQHQLGKFHEEFVNWDFSKSGFGIRTQVVLPLLVQNFDFSTFFAYGNLIDIFIERGYGHNLDPTNLYDTSLIELLEYLNEVLIDARFIMPTMMISAMHVKDKGNNNVLCYKHWTPTHCIRTAES